MIKKIKTSILSLMSLRKIVSDALFKAASSDDLRMVLTDSVPSGNVLVLAPHEDDEVFGCGGAIIKHVKQHDNVKIVFFTDGSSGFPDGFRPSEKEKSALVKTREDEARQAAETIGLDDLVFMGYKDGGLVANKNNISFLAQLIREYKPETIYVPTVNDTNHDHAELAKIFSQCFSAFSDRAIIFQYDVWNPMSANTILDIDAEIEQKKKAISVYKSQLRCRDYLAAIMGLNSYRGAIHGRSKYAESYLRSGKKFFTEYYKLLTK